jgi:hypothetical protein
LFLLNPGANSACRATDNSTLRIHFAPGQGGGQHHRQPGDVGAAVMERRRSAYRRPLRRSLRRRGDAVPACRTTRNGAAMEGQDATDRRVAHRMPLPRDLGGDPGRGRVQIARPGRPQDHPIARQAVVGALVATAATHLSVRFSTRYFRTERCCRSATYSLVAEMISVIYFALSPHSCSARREASSTVIGRTNNRDSDRATISSTLNRRTD